MNENLLVILRCAFYPLKLDFKGKKSKRKQQISSETLRYSLHFGAQQIRFICIISSFKFPSLFHLISIALENTKIEKCGSEWEWKVEKDHRKLTESRYQSVRLNYGVEKKKEARNQVLWSCFDLNYGEIEEWKRELLVYVSRELAVRKLGEGF